MDQEFQVGDKAVVPNQGVGVVKEIESKEIGPNLQHFYVIKLLDNGGTFHCPVGMAEQNKIRGLMDPALIPKVYEVLADRDKPADKQTWNRRYREYTKKITTNDLVEVAAVLRDLAVLRLGKTLSFGERKMYDRAYGLLIQEIAAVRDVDEEIIRAEVEEIFAEADAAATEKLTGKSKSRKKSS